MKYLKNKATQGLVLTPFSCVPETDVPFWNLGIFMPRIDDVTNFARTLVERERLQ
jgi:hypothetical protein